MQGLLYNVDIVLCIDATGSMHGIINSVKENALVFYDDLCKAMDAKGKSIDCLRVKVIPYRDYYFDGPASMDESTFYILPSDKEQFSAYVEAIKAKGGGDEPEHGLEALSLAISSDWNKEGDRRRQIIVVWTDASAHPLEKASSTPPPDYPQNYPKSFNELTDYWEGQGPMSFSAKRLIIYAPDSSPWTEISNHWENVIHFPSKAGKGLSEIDYSSIIDSIANSI